MKAFKMMISVLLIAVMLCSAAMAAVYEADVLTNTLKVYNAKKKYIGSLEQGTDIYVLDISRNGNWAKIYYKGKVGYASMQGIIFDDALKAICTKDTGMSFVTKSSYVARQAYKMGVSKGTLVNVVGYYNGQLLVESPSGNSVGVVPVSCFKKLK